MRAEQHAERCGTIAPGILAATGEGDSQSSQHRMGAVQTFDGRAGVANPLLPLLDGDDDDNTSAAATCEMNALTPRVYRNFTANEEHAHIHLHTYTHIHTRAQRKQTMLLLCMCVVAWEVVHSRIGEYVCFALRKGIKELPVARGG